MRLAAFAIVIAGRASGQESENTEPVFPCILAPSISPTIMIYIQLFFFLLSHFLLLLPSPPLPLTFLL